MATCRIARMRTGGKQLKVNRGKNQVKGRTRFNERRDEGRKDELKVDHRQVKIYASNISAVP